MGYTFEEIDIKCRFQCARCRAHFVSFRLPQIVPGQDETGRCPRVETYLLVAIRIFLDRGGNLDLSHALSAASPKILLDTQISSLIRNSYFNCWSIRPSDSVYNFEFFVSSPRL